MPEPMWEAYSADLTRSVQRLSEVPLNDQAAWAHAARDTAGVFAAWSRQVEPTPGPLADMARELARSGQIRANRSKPKTADSGSMMGAALLLAQASSSSTPIKTVMLVRQLMKAVDAISGMHAELGHTQRVEQLSAATARPLLDVQSRLPQYAGGDGTVPAESAPSRRASGRPVIPEMTDEARAAGISEHTWRAIHGGFGASGDPLSKRPGTAADASRAKRPPPRARTRTEALE
ncbi:hypothetical protein [Herbiconiux sp. VKM Ac-2851]|uniref:hypothetical protein n=1 Tax=Herbiconiux sp. VKM Ac-2851 TaxID=2739025 RepID=UPI0015643446|nr:hypothetical protein [Herbiconiux sp. VKM Ac-2851]NQX34719.1 hypothetical protein [Herbiconiux sp. VKM Ac-2851]